MNNVLKHQYMSLLVFFNFYNVNPIKKKTCLIWLVNFIGKIELKHLILRNKLMLKQK